jgi:hypothetical protein
MIPLWNQPFTWNLNPEGDTLPESIEGTEGPGKKIVKTPVDIGLNAVIVAVTDEVPRILTVKKSSYLPGFSKKRRGAGDWTRDALPFGPLDPSSDQTLERALRQWVREQTGLELGYVEQLYTFADRNRYSREWKGAPRMISIAYLALVREVKPSGASESEWVDWYRFFPWEDWRTGRPAAIDQAIAPALIRWVRDAPADSRRPQRRERIDISFGLGGVPWNGDLVLERYELLYEAGLAAEAVYDQAPKAVRPFEHQEPGQYAGVHIGQPMAFDHRRILATALGRLRGKIKYRPVVFELLPPTFTLWQLQRLVEALSGVRLHKQNLRRLLENGGLVEGTGRLDASTGGRPAELFRFRRDVLRERPAPGVGLPGLRQS